MNRFSRKLSHTTKLQIGLEEIKQVKQSGMSWRDSANVVLALTLSQQSAPDFKTCTMSGVHSG